MRRPLGGPGRPGLAVLAAIVVLLPWFLPNAFFFDVAVNAGLAAIVCVGLNLLIGYAGQISLGHAGFFALGAYSSAVLTETFGWPPLAALGFGMVAVGLLAFAVARPILRLQGHYLAMATLGLGIIVSIVLNQEVALTGGPDGMAVGDLAVAGLAVRGEWAWYWLVGIALIMTVWLALNLIDSPIGRALRAVHGAEIAAATAGIDTARHKALVFVISAVLASFAGSLFAHHTGFLTPDEASFFRSIEFVTMVVLGGMASVFGSVVGAVALTTLPQFLTTLHDYEQMAFGLILMLMMIFMPRGLVPSLARRFAGRR
jgi:branched-chain amino acid transport system permease protein